MKGTVRIQRSSWVLVVPILSCIVPASEPAVEEAIPSPIFADPHYRGACDPEVV
ncbi:MAG: hypothetical protein ACYTAO_04685 [Planctomycetota bacterium]